MGRKSSVFVGGALLLLLLSAGLAPAQPARAHPHSGAVERLDPNAIGTAVGTPATVAPDGVVRVSWERRDVPVNVDGVTLMPFAGLSSWAAFVPIPGAAMMMGDTVVFPDEVDRAMDAAFARGLEVTGLHEHFFHENPRVAFMHIGGMGDPVQLAQSVRGVWDAIRSVREARPLPAATFGRIAPAVPGDLHVPAIERILGREAQVNQGVAKVTIAREGTMHGVRVGGSMGLTTWIAFSGNDANAAIDGDVIMTQAEVQPVLRELRRQGLHVVALHNHMIGEEPAFMFTHFWAVGPAADLAQRFKAVLDAQSAVRG